MAAKKHHIARRHSAKHVIYTSFDSTALSTDTDMASQRQTSRGKTLLFCDASRTKIFDSPQPQNGPRSPKNLENDPFGSLFLSAVPKMLENTVQTWENSTSRNNTHFCDVHFSLHWKHIFVKPCLKQHACLAHPLRDLSGFFELSHLGVFRPPKKGGSNQEEGSKSDSRIEISIHPDPKEAILAKRGAIPSCERRKEPRACWPPCMLRL